MRYNFPMRIGMSTAAYYGRMETEESAALIASLGVPCCEAFLQTESEYLPSFGLKLRQMAGGMDVVSVHNRTFHFESDLLGQSPRQRADGFLMLETFLQTAQLLGAHVYVYHGPPRLRGANPTLDRWQPFMEEAIARCKARGVRLCWETVSWAWLNSMERIDEFARRWPEVGFTLDVKQVMELGLEPARVAERMGERLCHVHMLDYDENGRHALPGRGSSDFRAFSKALRAVEYQGDIILEPYAGQTEDTGEVLRSLEWLRETFHAE